MSKIINEVFDDGIFFRLENQNKVIDVVDWDKMNKDIENHKAFFNYFCPFSNQITRIEINISKTDYPYRYNPDEPGAGLRYLV